jgi:hypothetical protein
MKIVILLLLALFPLESVARDVHVNGHYRKDGTYVQPHYRTAPDNIKTNNYSYQGNVNPYTGKVGDDY